MRTLFLLAMVLLAGCSPAAKPKPGESEADTVGPAAAVAVVEQDYALGKGWAFRLPGKFSQRMEEDSLIFGRHGMTIYAVVWNNDKNESPAERLASIKEHASPEGFELQECQDAGLLRFSYRLNENRDAKVVHALYGYAIGRSGHVQMAVYFDREGDIETARKIWLSVKEPPDRQ